MQTLSPVIVKLFLKKSRNTYAWGGFLFRPVLQNAGRTGYRSLDLHGPIAQKGPLYMKIYAPGNLSRTIKSFQIELRQVTGFINSIHDLNFNT